MVIPKINSAHGPDTRNILNRAIELINTQGKSIQDLVAEGQLTPTQYAQLISIVNGNIARGGVVLDDINFNEKKITEGMIADSLLKIMTGNAPVHAIPPDNSITKSHLMTNSVTADKIPHTKNSTVYDVATWTLGGLSLEGNESVSSTRMRSDYISAKKGSVIKSLNNDVDFIAVTYDKNRKILGNGVGWVSEFEVAQENADYIRLNVRYKDNRVIQVTSDLSKQLIAHTFEGEKEGLEFTSPAKWEYGAIDIGNGVELEQNHRIRTKFMISEEGQYVRLLNDDLFYYIIFYDENMVFSSASGGWRKGSVNITHSYFRVVVRFDDSRVISGEDVKYIHNSIEINTKKITSDNMSLHSVEKEHLNFNIDASQLEGRKLLNLGDSIAGAATPGVTGYHRIIAQKNNMMMNSYASGGATFVVREEVNDNHLIKQVENAINNNVEADYILLNGGTNDANVVTPEKVGVISIGYDSVLDTTTFCGAFEYVLKTLRLNWLNAKIIYIRAHNMGSRDDRQITLGNLAIEICEKWSIPYVDLYKEGGLNTHIPEMIGTYTISDTDRTHPNTKGYTTFYAPLIESKMKSV